MKKCVNGQFIELTPEEIEELKKQEEDLPPPETTPEEKIKELKSQVTALQAELLKIGGSI